MCFSVSNTSTPCGSYWNNSFPCCQPLIIGPIVLSVVSYGTLRFYLCSIQKSSVYYNWHVEFLFSFSHSSCHLLKTEPERRLSRLYHFDLLESPLSLHVHYLAGSQDIIFYKLMDCPFASHARICYTATSIRRWEILRRHL